MGRRTVLLIVALVLAVAGGLLVWLYVQNIQRGVEEENAPVEVLVVTTGIPAGQTGAEAEAAGAFTLETLPSAAVPEGALSSTEPIADLVALSPLFPGEQVLAQKFGQPGGVTVLPIPEEKSAASIQLSDPARVAGFVQPGSSVSILVTAEPLAAGGDATANPETGDLPFTRVLLPKVEVLAAGQSTVATQTTETPEGEVTEEIPRAILTLALDQEEAQKVVFAQSRGELYFTLLNEEDAAEDVEVQVGEPTTPENLFTLPRN